MIFTVYAKSFPIIFFAFVLLFMLEIACEPFKVRIVIPNSVLVGCSATLVCLTSCSISSIYSIKWYRGNYEFYRYVPNENPPRREFNMPGIAVDIEQSNSTHVTLKHVLQSLSGTFTCEVSTDGPLFVTISDNATLQIVDNVEVNKPLIMSSEDVLKTDDGLHVSCMLPSQNIYMHNYSINFFEDDKQIDPDLILEKENDIFTVFGHLLEWKATSKCFFCQADICGAYKINSDVLCIHSSSDYTNFAPRSEAVPYYTHYFLIAISLVLLL